MMGEQQFCLRWNNHQSTLVSVFDTLLERNILVDCTLAADGQYLKAHKVLLCACSPYLELLLRQHSEKHPILILKDIKFQVLKSMMDYMYKGEVNISQDQLETFLKAAESLQIKGLTDSGGNSSDNDSRDNGLLQQQSRQDHNLRQMNQSILPASPAASYSSHSSTGLPMEPRRVASHISDIPLGSPIRSRESSPSPTLRKRRRHRRPSQADSEHFDNGCDIPVQVHSDSSNNVPSTSNQMLTTSTILTNNKIVTNDSQQQTLQQQQSPSSIILPDVGRLVTNLSSESFAKNVKLEPLSHTDVNLIEPKTELFDMNNDNSVDILPHDDDDDDMDGADFTAGPSHSAESSNQEGFSWSGTGDRITDELFATQEASGAQSDTQAE